MKPTENKLRQIVRKAINEEMEGMGQQPFTTYQKPTQTWQGQNNYMAKLYQVYELANSLGLNEIASFVQQKIQEVSNSQQSNMENPQQSRLRKQSINMQPKSRIGRF